MKKTIYLMTFLFLVAIVTGGCYLNAPATPNSGTPKPTFVDPMLEVEKKATQTAEAKLRTPKPEELATAQTAAAFALTRQALPWALVIILPDGSQHGFTFPELEAYATLTLDLFDASRQAVDVRSLLEEVKWTHFPIFSVTFEGRNSMTFHVDRLPQDAALYLDNGTVNFVSGEIPAEDWPYDVVLLIIR